MGCADESGSILVNVKVNSQQMVYLIDTSGSTACRGASCLLIEIIVICDLG